MTLQVKNGNIFAMNYDILVIGGGAAGIFAAISAKQAYPKARIALLEKSGVLLSKVRISGGGRCNVTHACFDPNLLVQNYPRGFRELKGPFHHFQPQDTIRWFESRGVPLKVEGDGRIFPVSNQSSSIIHCLLTEAQKLGVELHLRQRIASILSIPEGFQVGPFQSQKLILATGNSPEGHRWAESLGHTIEPAVPSLFTFNVPNSPLKELSGVSVEEVELEIRGSSFKQKGPLLITHFGFSGPAALKLSAWGARFLHEKEYQVELAICWLPSLTESQIFEQLVQAKRDIPQKMLPPLFHLPKSLWQELSKQLCLTEKRLNDISLKELQQFARKLREDLYQVQGKTTHKEEFVTCGGVCLKEVQFKTMESKVCPGLHFAGEILDIDGVTGGFNFQNAWTTGFLAGTHCNP